MFDQLSDQEPRPGPVPRQSESVPTKLHEATLEQGDQAIFAAAKKPDLNKQRVMTS